MAIEFATAYKEKIAEPFTLKSVTADDAGTEYKFLDPHSKTIRVSTVTTVPETPYRRTGENRFGTVHDIGDVTQEMTCTQAPAFTFTIDTLDKSDQAIQKSAARALRRQLETVTVPNMDKYRIKKWALGGNIVKLSASEPTKNTIGGLIIDLNAAMTDAYVPLEGRTIYIGTKYYAMLKQNPDWLGVDSLGKETLARGVVGEFDGARVKPIPTSYMPNGIYFFIKHKGCTVDPVKVEQYDVIEHAQGYSGPVVQGVTYYDAFVLGAKGDGIAVCGNSEVILPAPSASGSTGTFTLTCSGSDEIWYTVDGSNPRYSTTKKVYSASAIVAEDETIRVVGVKLSGEEVVGISPMTVKAYE